MVNQTHSTSYVQAVERLISQPQDYNLPRSDSDKYNKGVNALHEMKLTRDLLRGSGLEPVVALELIGLASEKGKSHIGVEILYLFRKAPEKPDISFEDVKDLVKNFVNELSCNQFTYGLCWQNCPHGVVPNEHYACSTPRISIGYEVLRDYAETDSRPEASSEALRILSEF